MRTASAAKDSSAFSSRPRHGPAAVRTPQVASAVMAAVYLPGSSRGTATDDEEQENEDRQEGDGGTFSGCTGGDELSCARGVGPTAVLGVALDDNTRGSSTPSFSLTDVHVSRSSRRSSTWCVTVHQLLLDLNMCCESVII